MNISRWLSRLGLGLVLLYCLGAAVFFSDFSELHLSFDFLPFPVFIGEILLLLCFLLFAAIGRRTAILNRRTALWLGAYFGWVIIKAVLNYVQDGPLTCRNAALFYYPAIAVFVYGFAREARLPRRVYIYLGVLVIGLMFFKLINVWFWWTGLMLTAIFVAQARRIQSRWFLGAVLGVVFALGFQSLYKGPRSHFVSILCSVCFLLFYIGIPLFKRQERLRLGLLLAAFALFLGGFFLLAEKNAVSSMVSWDKVMEMYRLKDELCRRNAAAYRRQNIPVSLYNPNNPPVVATPGPVVVTPVAARAAGPAAVVVERAGMRAESSAGVVSASAAENMTLHRQETAAKQMVDSLMGQVTHFGVDRERSLSLEKSNIVFRLFVWRDMAEELINERAWFGFSLGKPQRSRSLEIMNWAQSEWLRDGWITPHNSYFHVIYRAGILGFVLIAVLFLLTAGLIRDFFAAGSLEGGLLMAALVYWLAVTNFFVIFELPHNAILIWALLGVACAFREELVRGNREEMGL